METVSGTIIEIFPDKQITERFRKQDFGVKTEDQKPQELLFTCINDGCDMLIHHSAGDEVEIMYKVQGRKVKNRYFNTLTVAYIKHKNA